MRSEILLAIIAALTAGAAFAGFGDVICSWRVPKKGSGLERCEGLAWDGTYLWCNVEHGSVYDPYMYRCRSSDGSVVSSFPSGFNNYVRGFGMCHRKVRGVDVLEVIVWDSRPQQSSLYRYSFAGSITQRTEIRLPVSIHGVYYDGVSFWVTDPDESGSYVYRLNESGVPLSSFKVNQPGDANGVCKQADFLWFSIDYYGGPSFYGAYKARPNGSVVASFRPREFGQYSYDCTFDGEYLWVVSDSFMVFCVDVSNAPAVLPASVGRIKALYR